MLPDGLHAGFSRWLEPLPSMAMGRLTSNPVQRDSPGCAERSRVDARTGRASALARVTSGLVAPSIVSAVALVVMPAVPAAIVAMVTMLVITMTVIVVVVARGVFPLVPIVIDEEDGSSACIVLRAMPAPVSFVSRRNVQVDRLGRHRDGRRLDHDGLRIDHLGWRLITDVDLPIQSGLIEADRDADVARERRGTRRDCGDGK